MSAFREPAPCLSKPPSYHEFDEMGLGNITVPQPDKDLTEPSHNVASVASTAVVPDIEGQQSDTGAKQSRFSRFFHQTRTSMKWTDILGVVGIMVLLMLLWIVPLMILRSVRSSHS